MRHLPRLAVARRARLPSHAAAPPSLRPPALAFTLVELLVAIAIIALLLAVMLPVLGKARGAARTSVCGSNIHQLAVANTSYSADAANHYVAGAADMIANLTRWHGRRDSPSAPFDPARGPLAAYLGETGKVKQCPQFTDYLVGFEAGNGGYGYNNVYVGRVDPADFKAAVGASVDAFASPGQTVMFTDAAIAAGGNPPALIEYSFAQPPLWAWGGSADASIHFRHAGVANVVWLDAHVDRHALDFTASNVYGLNEAANRNLAIGWFGPRDNRLFDHD